MSAWTEDHISPEPVKMKEETMKKAPKEKNAEAPIFEQLCANCDRPMREHVVRIETHGWIYVCPTAQFRTKE